MQDRIRQFFAKLRAFWKRRARSLLHQLKAPYPEVVVGSTLGSAWARLTVCGYLFVVAVLVQAPLLALSLALWFVCDLWITYHLAEHLNHWLAAQSQLLITQHLSHARA